MENKNNYPKILVIHGPNLNMLGKREPEMYGKTTLVKINTDIEAAGKKLGLIVETFQSNHEGVIVEKIQSSVGPCQGLLLDIPVIEVHLSNIYKREPFRHKSMIADVATSQISGFGVYGYTMALNALAFMFQQKT